MNEIKVDLRGEKKSGCLTKNFFSEINLQKVLKKILSFFTTNLLSYLMFAMNKFAKRSKSFQFEIQRASQRKII
jgi:DNA topoisomerase IB